MEKNKVIAVIDGQGGGLGKSIIENIRKNLGNDIEIIALGTNSMATLNLLKSGANKGATGENSVVVMSQKVDFIIGPMAILIPNSLMGEITTKMVESIASSNAKKIIFPLSKCNVKILSDEEDSLNTMLERMVNELIKAI